MLSWTDWPARRRPRRAAFAASVVVGSVGLAASIDPVVGFVGALLLLASVRDGLFPTRFRLSEAGVEIRNPLLVRSRDWGGVGGWVRGAGAVTLLGRGRSGYLRRRRALVLRCPDHFEEVTAMLQDRLGEPDAA